MADPVAADEPRLSADSILKSPRYNAALARLSTPEAKDFAQTMAGWFVHDDGLDWDAWEVWIGSIERIEAEARSLSDSEPALRESTIALVERFLRLVEPEYAKDSLVALAAGEVRAALAAQPQPALPSEPPDPRGDKPPRRFPCPLCPEWFWSREDVARHQNGIHGAEPERERAGDPLDVEALEWRLNRLIEEYGDNALAHTSARHLAEWLVDDREGWPSLSSQSPVASEETP